VPFLFLGLGERFLPLAQRTLTGEAGLASETQCSKRSVERRGQRGQDDEAHRGDLPGRAQVGRRPDHHEDDGQHDQRDERGAPPALSKLVPRQLPGRLRLRHEPVQSTDGGDEVVGRSVARCILRSLQLRSELVIVADRGDRRLDGLASARHVRPLFDHLPLGLLTALRRLLELVRDSIDLADLDRRVAGRPSPASSSNRVTARLAHRSVST
jgi:hypothetical protein